MGSKKIVPGKGTHPASTYRQDRKGYKNEYRDHYQRCAYRHDRVSPVSYRVESPLVYRQGSLYSKDQGFLLFPDREIDARYPEVWTAETKDFSIDGSLFSRVTSALLFFRSTLTLFTSGTDLRAFSTRKTQCLHVIPSTNNVILCFFPNNFIGCTTIWQRGKLRKKSIYYFHDEVACNLN